MLTLLLALTCSLAVAMLLKYIEQKKFDRLPLLTINYLSACITSMVVLFASQESEQINHVFQLDIFVLGLTVGISFIATFFMMSWSIGSAGVSVAISITRTSVIIPFIASWLIWSETPSAFKWVGLGFALLAFLAMIRPNTVKKESRTQVAGILLVTFILIGANDVMIKYFTVSFSSRVPEPIFLTLVFGMAFFIGSIVSFFRSSKEQVVFNQSVLLWGGVLGVFNYASTDLYFRALEMLPGTFVFPFSNVFMVIASTVLGVLLWKEKLNNQHYVGILLCLISIILLNF